MHLPAPPTGHKEAPAATTATALVLSLAFAVASLSKKCLSVLWPVPDPLPVSPLASRGRTASRIQHLVAIAAEYFGYCQM